MGGSAAVESTEGARLLRVVAVDVDRLVRVGLGCLLRRGEVGTLVGEAAGAAEAVELAFELRPDVVLRGRSRDRDDADIRFRKLAREAPEIRTIVIGPDDDPVEVQAAFASGAAGFIVRTNVPDELEPALRTVAAGQLFLDPSVGGRLVAALSGEEGAYAEGEPRVEPLTARERQVLTLLSRGLTNSEIGGRLGISFRTVERHRTSLARKLGRRRRSQLAEYAREHGLA